MVSLFHRLLETKAFIGHSIGHIIRFSCPPCYEQSQSKKVIKPRDIVSILLDAYSDYIFELSEMSDADMEKDWTH